MFSSHCILSSSYSDRHYVGIPCFESLANQKTRQQQNQYLELQDLVLLLSERDLSNYLLLQRFILCALSIGFRLVIKCSVYFVCGLFDTAEPERSRKDR